MKIQKWDEINGTGSSEERMEAFLTSENDTYAILQLSYDQPEVTAYERFESLNGLARQGKQPNIDHYEVVYRGDAKRQLQKEIELVRGIQHKYVVCILDEAHLLEKEMLEEFRFLLNYRFDSMSPMALVLAGQTELWENKLRLQRYAAIRQRIDINCVLPHLDRSETEQYIHSHLSYAGSNRDIFSDKALDEVFKVTTGIPRMINRICEKSLMYSFQQQKRIIDDYMVKYVAEHEMLA